MQKKRFSYDLERGYYSKNWPSRAHPYLYLEPYLRSWLSPEEVFRGKRILDMGAGECGYVRLIAQKYSPSRMVACDLFVERMLPAARQDGNRQDGNWNLKFVAGDCFRLPFKTSSFDVVFGSLVLHQLPELRGVTLEIRRVLSEGGCYIGIEPNPYHPVHRIRYLWGGHSPNQYLLGPRDLTCFQDLGFTVRVRYFYAKAPWARGRFLGTCMGIVAQRR